MELYAGAALTGMGYLLNKQRSALNTSAAERTAAARPLAPEKPSMTNMYASEYYNAVRGDEEMRGATMTRAAQAPFATGVVPRPAYASMFAPTANPAPAAPSRPGAAIESSLSGQTIGRESFLPENTQPFFRGSVRQSLDPYANKSILENYTGRSDLFYNKKEVSCFFEPTAGFANVCGFAPNTTEFQRSRFVDPINRANDFPIEQTRVAPGLGLGFTAEGLGGFHQAATLDYIRPKTVDELRPGNKPKANLEARVQGPGKAVGTERGYVGEVAKNRVDTYYTQTSDQWLRTRGANDKERQRGIFTMKPTARVDSHVEHSGIAAGTSGRPGQGAADDFGKAAIIVYDNERQTTETRTVVSNLTSYVKAIVAPFFDVAKHGIKEYLIEAPRTFGNMQSQAPPKATVYDPVSQIMRTTIKETTIHDTTIANPRGRDAVPVAREDTARITVRETTNVPIEDTRRNVASHIYRVIMYNPDLVARTTVRETTDGAQNPVGNVAGGAIAGSEGAYTHIPVQVYATSKQFMSDNEYTGDAAGGVSDHRPMSQAAAHAMEVDATREALNIASGHIPAAGGVVSTGFTADNVSMESKALISDSIAARAAVGVQRVYQTAPVPIEACDLSRGDPMRPNAASGRLDPGTLGALRSNPFSISINPLASGSSAPADPRVL